jgi:hypothetical protein
MKTIQTIPYCLLLFVCCAFPVSASVFGDVRGTVFDPQQRAVTQARVILASRTSSLSRTADTNGDGEFSFRSVPIGEYTVTVESSGFSKSESAVIVLSDRTTVLRLQLKIAPVSQQVEVRTTRGEVGPDSPTPITLVSRKQIAQTPGASRTNSLAMITDYVPGAVVTHNQLHIRGGHQVTWLVDGIPVPNTNIADTVGPQFDPKDIDYLEVQQRAVIRRSMVIAPMRCSMSCPAAALRRDREAEFAEFHTAISQSDQHQLSFRRSLKTVCVLSPASMVIRSDYGLENAGR